MATEEVEDPDLDIAVSLIEESKEELEQTVKFWTIIHHAREAKLVDDMFVDDLMKQGLSANSNEALLSMLIERIKGKELWFNRFLNVLSDSARYRRLAKQLSRSEQRTALLTECREQFCIFQVFVPRFVWCMVFYECQKLDSSIWSIR